MQFSMNLYSENVEIKTIGLKEILKLSLHTHAKGSFKLLSYAACGIMWDKVHKILELENQYFTIEIFDLFNYSIFDDYVKKK